MPNVVYMITYAMMINGEGCGLKIKPIKITWDSFIQILSIGTLFIFFYLST